MKISFNTLIISLLATILFFYTQPASAQSPNVPTPGAKQSKSILLFGGVAHIGNGEVIQQSLIRLENGKIASIGEVGYTKPIAGNQQDVIDISGKHVYPPLIAPTTSIGLVEIDAVRATRDFAEVGGLNPNVRSIIAYNTDSRVTPTIRSNGVLLAQVAPLGGRLAGTSSIVTLDAWNWEDAAYQTDDALHLRWPSMFNRSGWWANPGGTEKNKKYEKQTTQVEDLFEQAKAYCEAGSHESTNLKLESMCGIFNKEMSLFVEVDFIKEIIEAVHFAQKYDIKIVIVGGRDAWMATDILKENNIPVIVLSTQRLPARADEDTDIMFRLPSILQKAGIQYCIGMEGDAWNTRNLIFQAGSAAAYGLTKEQAISAVTANTAKILGIDKTVGTLEAGKDATLIVSKGDILDMRTSHIEYAFIQGRQVSMDNKQKSLYRKFMNKYKFQPIEK